MRVLITSPVFPPDLGGPAVYVPSIGRFLVERGHEVTVVAFCSSDNPSEHPFEVIPVPRGPLPIRYLKAFFAVLREAQGKDVVYVQEHLALLHVLAAKLRGVPTVIRIMVDGAWEISHRKGWIDGDDIVTFEGKQYGPRVRLARFLQRRWWGWCTAIISCSDFLRRILVDRYDVENDKVHMIHNAHHGKQPEDVPQTPQEARAELNLPEGPKYLLTICRLMVWKRVDGILNALRGLPQNVHLLVAGDGEMEMEWRGLASELGLEGRVRFLGNVPHDQIPLYIRAADVFVLNSEYEGLSHTLIEVQTLGTAIVCTGVCGNPEVVEHEVSGLLVPPRDDAALREALRRLLEDRDMRQRFISAGYERAKSFVRETTFAEVERVLVAAAGTSNKQA